MASSSDAGNGVVLRSDRTRALSVEVLCNVLLIAAAPLIIRLLARWLGGPLRGFGFVELFDLLSGNGKFTDIGIEVASARGLLDRGFSAYDSWGTLSPLIGMFGYGAQSHTHPPPALVLEIPLAGLDYQWWLSFWAVASFCAIAVSMRVLAVPVWVAYPLAMAISVTPAGTRALESTYPLMALMLAVAWRFRDSPTWAGISYAIIGVSRGVGAVLLLYPVARRQWRTVAITVTIVLVLTAVAVALEPTVVADYWVRGRETIDQLLQSPDLYTFDSLLARRGLPRWIWWTAAVAVFAVGALRRRNLFWLLAWLMFALTPIAWTHTAVSALPLVVVMWQSGRLGRFFTLVIGIVFVGLAPVGWNAAWPWLIAVTAVGVLICPIGEEETLDRRSL